MKRIKAYKYRLYPNAKQKELLAKHFGCARWVYNYGLAKKIEYYKQHEKSYSRYDLQKDLVVLKKQDDTEWLKEVCAQSLQVVLKNLDAAYTSFFRKKSSFPRFKSRRNKQSVAFPQNTKVDFDNNRIQVIKFIKDGGIKCKFHRTFDGAIK
ncbi:MAG TPA: RNA-guided endonuclease TnpB family protein, partial [Methanosarcinales archaeon]|nr:RNA-guided endonuclease TnpB family protein [Methanosarcinales archaeon]